ncbi:hypothetical protein QE152_g15439 [Popillia japonica]|uniref:Uncharacterized protein n=1 Tax=Popillia japonica TaxID=7064 RepID=A0AAW1L8H7_POPJA
MEDSIPIMSRTYASTSANFLPCGVSVFQDLHDTTKISVEVAVVSTEHFSTFLCMTSLIFKSFVLSLRLFKGGDRGGYATVSACLKTEGWKKKETSCLYSQVRRYVTATSFNIKWSFFTVFPTIFALLAPRIAYLSRNFDDHMCLRLYAAYKSTFIRIFMNTECNTDEYKSTTELPDGDPS